MNYELKSYVIAASLILGLSVTAGYAQLPDPGMKIDPANTAWVVTDPQNDFLSRDGVTWGMVGKA